VLDVCNKNTLTGEGDNLDATQPAWSPDGARIAFTSISHEYPCGTEISVINADGSGQRQLTGNGGPTRRATRFACGLVAGRPEDRLPGW